MKNREVARLFEEIAQLLEIKEENPFKIRAYRNAARTLEGLTEDLTVLAAEKRLTALSGIGKDLAQKIEEFLSTGRLEYHEGLKREIPEGVLNLLSVPGVGPKTAKLFFEKLTITTVVELERAAREGKLRTLPGVREKTEGNILKGIELIQKGRERTPLEIALPIAEEIVARLQGLPEVRKIEVAGSLRRRRETVKDIDILITSSRPGPVMEAFTTHSSVRQILARGETKSSILTTEGIQVDLRVVQPASFGAALAYFTGSKAHNIRLRDMASRRGLKINEYGVFREKDGQRLAGRNEGEIYKALGLPHIPPEMREDAGEVEAALKGRLPDLVELAHIRGDLHMHTKWTDGAHSLEEMVGAARAKGYAYVAITDHSQSTTIARGLTVEELLEKIRAVESLRRRVKGIAIFTGSEVDIKGDGSLDYPDEVLAKLDVVVAAVHSGFRQSREAMTKRIVTAMENRYVQILAHPSGRLIGERAPYEVDWEAIFAAAKRTGVALEINAQPSRLDLTDVHARRAMEIGLRVSIDTDSHATGQLDFLARFGVPTARRGWVERGQVVNALPLARFRKFLGQRRG